MYAYRQLKETLGLRNHALLSLFEQYCSDMGSNTRVFEWSCKITGSSLEGARFVHTSLSPGLPEAQGALDQVYSCLFPEGEPQEPGQNLFYRLRPLARRMGEGFVLGYAEQGEANDRHCEIKVYVLTSQIQGITPLLEPLVPRGALPPAGTPKVMMAASMDDQRVCQSRAYYIWDRVRLTDPACLDWLDMWCTTQEVELVLSSRNRAVAVSFKDGTRDMLYWTAPFNQPQLNRFLMDRLENHRMAYSQLGHLRHMGLSKRREGLESQELNVYFNSVFG
jgi:hypothetical protein